MADIQNPFSSPRFDPAPNGTPSISDARRLAARILLVLACLFFAQATCCTMGVCIALIGAWAKQSLEGKLGAGFGLAIIIFISVGLGGGLLVLRKLILNFNRVAAVIAAVLACIGVCLGFLGVCGNIVAVALGNGGMGLVSLAVSALWMAAFAQLLVYLIKVLKEP